MALSEARPANLAEKSFWENDYFADVPLPARPDPATAFDRTLAGELERRAPLGHGESVIEIGCSPARWLVWYAERFGARPVGIEYSAKGAELSRRNMVAAGVEGEVHEGDFFSEAVSRERHDLVLSLGFIEHFDDLERAFARHKDFMKPGGRLAIGVPNFRGLTGLLQRWGDPELLALHNRDAMRPALYREMAPRLGLEVESVTYLDGIDPYMVRVSRRGPAIVMLPLTRWRRLAIAERVNGRLISSYLLMTFRERS